MNTARASRRPGLGHLAAGTFDRVKACAGNADDTYMTPSPPMVAHVRTALAPYPWRRLTAQMLARRVVGAVDAVPEPLAPRPAPRDDRRVEPLVHVLQTQLRPWRALAVGEVCRRLLHALAEWEAQDAWLDVELAWLLDARH